MDHVIDQIYGNQNLLAGIFNGWMKGYMLEKSSSKRVYRFTQTNGMVPTASDSYFVTTGMKMSFDTRIFDGLNVDL